MACQIDEDSDPAGDRQHPAEITPAGLSGEAERVLSLLAFMLYFAQA